LFRPEGGEKKIEPWNSKLISMFAAFGYSVGLRSAWCFRTWHRSLLEVS